MCAGPDVQDRKLKQLESTRLARARVYFMCLCVYLLNCILGVFSFNLVEGYVPADNVVGRNRAGTDNYYHFWRVVPSDAQDFDIVMYIL